MRRPRRPRTFVAPEVVDALYIALLARRAAPGEGAAKVGHLRSGGSIEAVVESILASPELATSFYDNPIFDPLTAPDPLPPDALRLYVCHIPKTAGTSLREMLRPHFAPSEFIGGVTLAQLYRMSRYRLLSYRVFVGHFGPALPLLLADVPLVTATVVRDPLDTALSHYRHWRQFGAPGHPFTALARAEPFDQWCRAEATRGLWSNPQAGFLCLPRVLAHGSEAALAPDGLTIGVPADELLGLATATLERVDIVGTVDDLAAVYSAAVARLGLEPTPGPTLRENATTAEAVELSPSTRDWLLEHNTVDSVLFETARRRGQARPPDPVPLAR